MLIFESIESIKWLRKWVWREMKKSLGFGLELGEVEKGWAGSENADGEKRRETGRKRQEMKKREGICRSYAFFSDILRGIKDG